MVSLKYIEPINRDFWMDKANTTIGNQTTFKNLYPNISELVHELASIESTKECYILSLINPIKPHLKLINCSKPVLKYFVCENQQMANHRSVNMADVVEFNILKKCSSGEYVSSKFICDGHEDCVDASDESNCFCFVNNEIRIDNAYCSRKCTQTTNCKCAPLYSNSDSGGCSSYVYEGTSHNETVSNVLFSCRNSSQSIKNSLVNDLILDCPFGDDEPELFNVLLQYRYKCPRLNMTECYPGHSKCYTQEQKCTYLLDLDTNTLQYCRNGHHLQDCQHFKCIWMYKCSNSYCIPFSYLSDEKWDCWTGEDEVTCENYSCPKLFKCRQTFRCIHMYNICDGNIDCPMNDDEILCDVKHCIDQCICLNHAIKCNDSQVLHSTILYFQLGNFVFVDMSYTKNIQFVLHLLKNTLILISKQSFISKLYSCNSLDSKIKLQILDLSFNKILVLKRFNFNCLP